MPGGTRIEAASDLPKHAQLRTILLTLIEDERAVGEAIPSERELAQRFGLSRMTARQAVDALVTEGRLRRVPGRGTFVARPKILMPLRLASFSEDMRARGLAPGAVDLGHRVAPAPDDVAAALALPPGSPVCVVARLRTADGAPMAVERAHLPADVVPGLADRSLADQSLYAVLADAYGLVLDAGEQTIEAGLADEADASLLGLAPGSPVLLQQRTSSAAGRPVEHTVSSYRGDRYRLRVTLDVPAPDAPPPAAPGTRAPTDVRTQPSSHETSGGPA